MGAERPRDLEEWKSHDVRETAGDLLHEYRAETLDRVRTRLAARLSCRPVRPHLGQGDFPEHHLCLRQAARGELLADQAEAGPHLMRAPGQKTEHPDAVVLILRFFENVFVYAHRRIGSEHGEILVLPSHRDRLVLREAADIQRGILFTL